MRLSPHFTMAELTASAKAQAMGIDNMPPPEFTPRLIMLAEMLERVRGTLGVPVIVTSGYRCQRLNQLVGGVTSSDHTRGYAADVVAPQFGTAQVVARTLAPLVATLGIGQIILEGINGKQWVHLSTMEPERSVNRVLTITDAGVHVGIVDLTTS